MNERIKELDKQAKLWAMDNTNFPISSHIPAGYTEKFAELIVKECVTQCSKALVEHTGQPSVTHNYAVGLCQDSIKEHFGVE